MWIIIIICGSICMVFTWRNPVLTNPVANVDMMDDKRATDNEPGRKPKTPLSLGNMDTGICQG